MRRVLSALVVGALLLGGSAYAQEDPAPEGVIPESGTVWQLIKDSVNIVDPKGEALYRFEKGEWDLGVAGSLYDAIDEGHHLGRAKIGYGLSNYGYIGADVDLAGIYGRFAGGKFSALDKVASVWSRFGTTGIHGGRDFEAQDWDYGFTIGASIPLP